MGLLGNIKGQYEPLGTDLSPALRHDQYREKHKRAREYAHALLFQRARKRSVKLSGGGTLTVENATVGSNHHINPELETDTLTVTIPTSSQPIDLLPELSPTLDTLSESEVQRIDAVLEAFGKVDKRKFVSDNVPLKELIRRKLRGMLSYWSSGMIRFK